MMFTKLVSALSVESIPEDSRYSRMVNDSKISENGVGRIVNLIDKPMKTPPQSTWLETKEFIESLKVYKDELKEFVQANPGPVTPRKSVPEQTQSSNNDIGDSDDDDGDDDYEFDINATEAQIFQNGLENIYVIERELMEQQNGFEQSFREQFSEPIKALLVSETHKMLENKAKLERCKRDYEVAKMRAVQAESQVLNNTGTKLPDGDRLLSSIKDSESHRDLYEHTLESFIDEAELASSNRYVVMMQAFRMLLMQQLARFKLAIATIESKEAVINSAYKRLKAVNRRTIQERANGIAKRQEEQAEITQHKFDILKSFVVAYPDELLNASLEPQLREFGDDVVRVVSSTLESKGLVVDKLNKDINKHIILNKDTNANQNRALFALRATSGFSRLMSAYSKMCCTQWLNTVMADPMTELIASADKMEIVLQKCKPRDGKTLEETHQENVEEFKRICRLFLDNIFESTNKCPV